MKTETRFKACDTCRKQHLKCDNIRPCTRCVRRGTPHLCAASSDPVVSKPCDFHQEDVHATTRTDSPSSGSHEDFFAAGDASYYSASSSASSTDAHYPDLKPRANGHPRRAAAVRSLARLPPFSEPSPPRSAPTRKRSAPSSTTDRPQPQRKQRVCADLEAAALLMTTLPLTGEGNQLVSEPHEAVWAFPAPKPEPQELAPSETHSPSFSPPLPQEDVGTPPAHSPVLPCLLSPPNFRRIAVPPEIFQQISATWPDLGHLIAPAHANIASQKVPPPSMSISQLCAPVPQRPDAAISHLSEENQFLRQTLATVLGAVFGSPCAQAAGI